MIDWRWAWPLLGFFMFCFVIAEGTARAVVGVFFINTLILMLVFERNRIEVRGHRIFESQTEQSFDEWLSTKPDIQHAVKVGANLSHDDFMTFCRIMVEVRYHQDQKTLALVSKYFRREK